MEKLDPKIDGSSKNIIQENIDKLKEIFPDVFTESKVDFDRLKETLGEYIDDNEERYSFSWHGKSKARRIAQTPSTGTLRPCKEESKNWDTTQNLFIEGDNLEVLKLLQKSYHKKVKMIYIDPPYNTGKEFIYPDNYKDNLATYLRYSGQIDDDGYKFSSNTEQSGRYHTNWLNMMYPRLKLARNLLRDDGVIFISIDDNEAANLKKMCDEIFGEDNFCAVFVWNTEGNTDNQYKIKVNHEYILCYYKNSKEADKAIGRVIDPNTPKESNLWKGFADNNINKNNPANPPAILELPIGFPSSENELFYPKKNVNEEFFEITQKEKFISDKIKEEYDIENQSGLPVKLDDMVIKNFKLVKPCRIYVGMANRDKLLKFIDKQFQPIDDGGMPLKFYINRNSAVRYRKINKTPRNILSVLRNLGTTEKTKTYLKKIEINYDYPKPISLLEYIIQIGCENENGIVIDFFAGSGTTANAVFNLNTAKNQNKKFILIQLPEPCDEKSEAFKAGYKTIADIGKERIRRAGAKIVEKNKDKEGIENLDIGFKVFKLDSSNIKPWDTDFDTLEDALMTFVENIKDDRTEDDVLYELLLKYGLDLTLPIEERKINGKTVFSIGFGALVICLDSDITIDVVEGIGKLKKELDPEIMRVVFKDNGFKNDVVKTNAIQILKQYNIEDVKSL